MPLSYYAYYARYIPTVNSKQNINIFLLFSEATDSGENLLNLQLQNLKRSL